MRAGELTRVGAGVAALAAGVAAVVVVSLLLSSTPGPVAAASPSPAPAATTAAPLVLRTGVPAGFPAPPRGAFVLARPDGADVLALAAVPEGGGLLLQASVLGPQGKGVPGLAVSFALDGRSARAAACGAGCYRALLPAARPPAAVAVDVHGGAATTRWRVSLPAVWPPVDATALMARAGRVWRALRSLTFHERLASDPAHTVTSVWRTAAPDRVAYTVKGGYSSVIIGGRRWDRPPGGRWVASTQTAPIHQPVPFWQSVADAHVVGSARLRGREIWRVSFFDPGTPGWFEVALDKRTSRTLELSMFATAHFMHDAYSGFDAPPAIEPPG